MKILLTSKEMSNDFVSEALNISPDKIIDISKSFENLRDFIKVIDQFDIFIGPSTGPMHIADALGKSAIVIHCHRAMSCAIHQGMINKNSINLEVSGELCNKYCSADQNTCGIEKALGVDVVISSIKTLYNRKIETAREIK